MIQKITEDELRFAELLHDPIAVIENLVPKNHDAPSTWSKEEECIRIRLYQIPTLSYEYLVADDPKKTEQENFDLKKSAGQGYNIGGRKFGKSFVTIFCDALLTIIHYTGKIVVLASFDSKHLKTRMEEICNYVSLHPFFKIFHLKGVKIDTVSRSPYKIQMRHGLKFYGINENIYGKNPGTDYHQHHYHKFIYEEASYESETGHTKRVDSTSELGAIERLSGIPDVTDSSYLGQVLNNPKKKGEVIRLPQYVRFNWTDEAKNNAIEEYDGEGSIDYKLNVDGIKIEGAHGIFDMERVKDCFNDQKQVKVFQISKDDIKDLDDSEFKEVLKNKIIIDKIPSEFKYICADIGDGNAPTEIIIVYKLDEKYIYSYNITLNSLTDDEQYKVFKWLYDKLDGAFTGLDCSILPDEFVLVKINNKLKYLRIKELENFKNCLVEVPTFNQDKLEWKPAKLTSHEYDGNLKTFSVDVGNYHTTVTDNHSVMRYTKAGLEKCLAEQVQIGDWFLSPKNLNFENKEYQILEYFERDINQFKKGEKQNIILDEELGYLFGLAVAEGSSKTSGYQFSFGDEKELAEYTLGLTQKLFKIEGGYIQKIIPEYTNSKPYTNIVASVDRYTVIAGGGKNLLKFFSYHVGSSCYRKKVPECIFNSPRTVQESFLCGLVEGDGHYRNRASGEYSIHSSSYELISGLLLLGQLLNKPFSYTQNTELSYTCYWNNSPTIGRWDGIPYEVLGIKNGKSRRKKKVLNIDTLTKNRPSKEKVKEFKRLRDGDWRFHKVKKIQNSYYKGKVYDLIVKDNHTFVAGAGNILVHNTDGTGRAIYRELAKKIGTDHLVYVHFNKNMTVGFEEKDGKIVRDKNKKATLKQENTMNWADKTLKKLLYKKRIELYMDEKFYKQFSSYKIVNGKRKTSKHDHLLQAFQVFAITHWNKESKKAKKKRRITGVGAV